MVGVMTSPSEHDKKRKRRRECDFSFGHIIIFHFAVCLGEAPGVADGKAEDSRIEDAHDVEHPRITTGGHREVCCCSLTEDRRCIMVHRRTAATGPQLPTSAGAPLFLSSDLPI
jgi:hypothetical protein